MRSWFGVAVGVMAWVCGESSAGVPPGATTAPRPATSAPGARPSARSPAPAPPPSRPAPPAAGSSRLFGSLGPRALATLDLPAFTAAPRDLLAASAAALGPDGMFAILEHRVDGSLDDAGRLTVRARWVIATDERSAPEALLRASELEWRPSYQERPALRARTIDEQGGEQRLAASAFSDDEPVTSLSPWVHSDRRRVKVSLSGDAKRILELEAVTVDRTPHPIAESFALRGFVAGFTARTVVTFEAPAARHVQVGLRGLPRGVRPSHSVTGGRERWRLDLRARAGEELTEDWRVAFSSAPSWAQLAQRYRAALERRISDGGFALPPELARPPTLATTQAITAWVRERVRFTGVALDDGEPMPASPADTAQRRYGDSTSISVLLASLLRQAGIRAEVALVAPAPWASGTAGRLGGTPAPEPQPGVPSLVGFQRAMVRAEPEGRAVWIDAAEPMARVGQLVAAFASAPALVLAADTSALTTTPAAEDLGFHAVRTYDLEGRVGATITEKIRWSGPWEIDHRRRADDLNSARIQARLVAATSLRATLVRVTTSGARDLESPLARTIVARAPRDVRMFSDHLEVALHVADVLPFERPDGPNGDDGDDGDEASDGDDGDDGDEVSDDSDAREYDATSRARVAQIEHRIVVPTGFTLPAPAPDRVRTFGAARLTERQRLEGRTLVVTFRFEDPAAMAIPQLRAALRTVRREVTQLRVDHTAFALLAAGKPRAAIEELLASTRAEPTVATHQQRLATLLIMARAGEAARRAARAATAIAPDDPETWMTLGWVLTHDTLGRRFTYDWDRTGAIAAFDKARSISADPAPALIASADVRVQGKNGWSYEPGPDLTLATEAMRDLFAATHGEAAGLSLARLQLYTDEIADAEATARALTSEAREPLLVTATALTRGLGPAIQLAAQLRKDAARASLLTAVARQLFALRAFDLARALAADQKFPPLPPELRRQPAIPLGSANPLDAAREAALAARNPELESRVFATPAVEVVVRAGIAHSRLPEPGSLTLSGESDYVSSFIRPTIEGDADAWRVDVGTAPQVWRLYVALDRGRATVIGTPETPGELGRHALALLQRDRQASALRLLRWVLESERADGGADELAEILGAAATPERARLTLAAAWLAASVDPEHALPALTACPVADLRTTCALGRIRAHMAAKRWGDAERELGRARSDPRMPATWRANLHAEALAWLGRLDDAERVNAEALALAPSDRRALTLAAELVGLRGQPARMGPRIDALVSRPSATGSDRNTAAWLRLAAGLDLDRALIEARAAAAQQQSRNSLHTLAAVEAERGELTAAMDDLFDAMTRAAHRAPRPEDWYVIGRVLEQLGLTDDAIAAYRKVTPTDEVWGSCHMLAARRLAGLPARP